MFQMIGLIGSVVGAAGQMAAGRAAQESAELNAFNIETDKVRSETEARQRHNDRLEQYRSNLSANIAAFSAAGRDISDRSVQAFLEKQKEIASDDTRRSDFMGAAEAARLQQQATASRVEGRAQRQAATIGAFTTLANGISNFGKTGGSASSSGPPLTGPHG